MEYYNDGGSFDMRIKIVSDLLEASPENAYYYHRRGCEYYSECQYENAENDLRIAARIAPDESKYHFDLGDALYMQQEYDEALLSYESAISATTPDDPMLHFSDQP